MEAAHAWDELNGMDSTIPPRVVFYGRKFDQCFATQGGKQFHHCVKRIHLVVAEILIDCRDLTSCYPVLKRELTSIEYRFLSSDVKLIYIATKERLSRCLQLLQLNAFGCRESASIT